MNLLIFSDIHIIEKDLSEIEVIFEELLFIKNKYNIHKIIIAGDTFDKINPTPKELDYFSEFLKKLDIPIILIVAKSHESISPTETILNHFGILNSKLQILSEYKENEKLYVGHFIIKQSSKNHGGTVDKQQLKDYTNVLLGHGHNFELIKPNICQLGSIRFFDFGEDSSLDKRVAICENYNTNNEKWQFLALNSPYPMVSLQLGKELKNNPIANDLSKEKVAGTGKENAFLGDFEAIPDLNAYLDELDSKMKVRIIFTDYELWREFLPHYNKYKEKFFVFRDKKDFLISEITPISAKSEKQPLKESLLKFMKDNKIEKKIQDILLEEIK